MATIMYGQNEDAFNVPYVGRIVDATSYAVRNRQLDAPLITCSYSRGSFNFSRTRRNNQLQREDAGDHKQSAPRALSSSALPHQHRLKQAATQITTTINNWQQPSTNDGDSP